MTHCIDFWDHSVNITAQGKLKKEQYLYFLWLGEKGLAAIATRIVINLG